MFFPSYFCDVLNRISLYFGLVTAGAGILGVVFGSEIARRQASSSKNSFCYILCFSLLFRRYRRINPRGDPIVCGSAVLLAMPFLYFVIVLSNSQIILVWIFIFTAETLLCSNWALISDMLMVEFIYFIRLNTSFFYCISFSILSFPLDGRPQVQFKSLLCIYSYVIF